ncbi:hypothetical protein QE422_001261 [Chryseobacterium sp. SORGH_AS 447]|uniref:DUF4468 domain-containing protein n=1 Tax=Chryseobacterium sp. SORGH_AS_0447 TaxID=3041769 RepID=UPI00277E0940|nr:DUF4468 domain-containing protein [Chryseobacterium sp. SORGH_AS_0447]MDQ1160893.1 hypothetical protein [Chryseobacterium sp. SORGH_AS_0447]
MKKVILTAFLFFSIYSYSQSTEFVLNKDGFTDYLVIDAPQKSASMLYEKTIEWINKTYNNPREVIKANIKDDYVRLEGIKSDLYCYSPLGLPVCFDVRYQIEVSFKDNKYKFDIAQLEEYVKPSQYTSGGWRGLMTDNSTSGFFKKDGSIKGGYKNYLQNIPDYFNNLQKSLSDYINSTGMQAQKKDW